MNSNTKPRAAAADEFSYEDIRKVNDYLSEVEKDDIEESSDDDDYDYDYDDYDVDDNEKKDLNEEYKCKLSDKDYYFLNQNITFLLINGFVRKITKNYNFNPNDIYRIIFKFSYGTLLDIEIQNKLLTKVAIARNEKLILKLNNINIKPLYKSFFYTNYVMNFLFIKYACEITDLDNEKDVKNLKGLIWVIYFNPNLTNTERDKKNDYIFKYYQESGKKIKAIFEEVNSWDYKPYKYKLPKINK